MESIRKRLAELEEQKAAFELKDKKIEGLFAETKRAAAGDNVIAAKAVLTELDGAVEAAVRRKSASVITLQQQIVDHRPQIVQRIYVDDNTELGRAIRRLL